MDKELVEAARETLEPLKSLRSNESKLLKAMSKLPEKYDWTDFNVRLQVSVELPGGRLEISRWRGHSTSEPFSFQLVSDEGEVARIKFLGDDWVIQ